MSYGEGLRRNRCGVWCWRWVVPADVRSAVGAVELLRSLGTASKREAVERAIPLRMAALLLLRHIRAGHPMSELSKQTLTILRLVAERKAAVAIKAQDEAEQRAATEAAAAAAKIASLEEGIRAREKAIRLALHKVTQAQQAALQQAALQQTAPAPAAPAVPAGVLLSVAIEAFMHENMSLGRWEPKTAEAWQAVFKHLLNGLGDRDITTVTRDDCSKYLERLKRLPSNASKKAALKGKTFLELTAPEITGFPVLATGTVNDQMGQISGFFGWAIARYELSKTNPASGLQLSTKKRKDQPTKRIPFTETELLALFGREGWKSREFLHPHYYWLMILGIYTGARINELCQLRLIDFIQVEGIDVINLADEDDEGLVRAKNANARRRVPIHPELIRLGLLRWVETRRTEGGVNLFDEINPGPNGDYGHYPSKWFGRYRKRCGIMEKQSKVFHSFRTGFISHLFNVDVATPHIANIVGHEIGTVTGDVYWTDRDAASVLRSVEKFSLPASVRELIPNIEAVTFTKQKPEDED